MRVLSYVAQKGYYLIKMRWIMKTTTVRARVEPKLKHSVEPILAELGLSFSEAIEIYLRQIKLNNGIPFEIRIPNKVTRKTFEDTNKKKNLKHYKSSKVMFAKLGLKEKE